LSKKLLFFLIVLFFLSLYSICKADSDFETITQGTYSGSTTSSYPGHFYYIHLSNGDIVLLTLTFPSTVDYDFGILCEEQYIRLYVHDDSGYSEHMTHWAYSGHHFDEIEYGVSEHIEFEVPHDGRYLINILHNAGHGSYQLKVEVHKHIFKEFENEESKKT